MLKLNADESQVCLDLTETPEFDSWRWVDFWYPGDNVVHFKREVYVQALHLLSPFARILEGEVNVPKQAGDDLVKKMQAKKIWQQDSRKNSK